MAGKKLSFEQAMNRLEEIVRTLEEGEGTLDQSMTLFEEGSRLAALCSDMLDKAEQKVTQLSADGDSEIPFEVGD